jgi:hypothetical protein
MKQSRIHKEVKDQAFEGEHVLPEDVRAASWTARCSLGRLGKHPRICPLRYAANYPT